jgi:hypothetical protein
MTTIFENIVDADQVEGWVRDTLELWFNTYMREFELAQGIDVDTLPRPRSWRVAETVDREATDQLPTVVIVSPGLNGDRPMQEGDGSFRAIWTVGVGIFVSAATREDTKRLVRWYGAIIRAIMLQKQSFGGNADGSSWLDESYDDNFNFTDDQTISAGQVIFDVEVANVITRFAGPTDPIPDPDTQPGSQWGVVTKEKTFIDVKKEG